MSYDRKHTKPFDGKPVATWIIPALKWARRNGWSGRVISGCRTDAEQLAAAKSYGLGHYRSGPLASNHVRSVYPGGAVDVTRPEELARVLQRRRTSRPLKWGGPVMGDYPHFSATGR